ncbi:hypothetical protein DNTS_011871 [Danionella cerebrum]|nr:hypothetical protein DNTS_011871 [Danionella translucida]
MTTELAELSWRESFRQLRMFSVTPDVGPSSNSFKALLARRCLKRPREDEQQLQKQCVNMLMRNQNTTELLREITATGDDTEVLELHTHLHSVALGSKHTASVSSLRWQLSAQCLCVCSEEELSLQTSVPVALLSARALCQKIGNLTRNSSMQRGLLTAQERAEVCVLLQSARARMAAGVFSTELLWQEIWSSSPPPPLELIYLLHTHAVLRLELILDREAAVSSWLTDRLQALCVCIINTAEEEEEEEEEQLLRQILHGVGCAVVRAAFEASSQSLSLNCVRILDSMMSWLLESLSDRHTEPPPPAAAVWVEVLDAAVLGASVSENTLRRFCTHSLARLLTDCPVYKGLSEVLLSLKTSRVLAVVKRRDAEQKGSVFEGSELPLVWFMLIRFQRLEPVSDAIETQSEWSFAKTPPTLTALLRKVCVLLSAECVLKQLQQVLETHEVNWRLILSCVSHLLIFHPQTQSCLSDLLTSLRSSAFEGFDQEKMVMLFLLARQASLEGPPLFPSYSDWFKLSFGGSSGLHTKNKKCTAFLLKFLSDLVPFEPPQYLKVHLMHPPLVSPKLRSLLQEYVILAKTRLQDLKVSVEDSGIFQLEPGTSSTEVRLLTRSPNIPHTLNCPAQQDVERAISLFSSSRKIPASVIEASIFRRPYFLSRFLPALLSPRTLPEQSDARESFIQALRRVDKIPAALCSSYSASHQGETLGHREGDQVSLPSLLMMFSIGSDHTDCITAEAKPRPFLSQGRASVSSVGDLQRVLQEQLQALRRSVADGAADGEVCELLSGISLTFRSIENTEETAGSDVISLLTPDRTRSAEAKLVFQSFCLCLLQASRIRPLSRQGCWAGVLLKVLLAHRWLLSALLHLIWDLLRNQGESVSAPHLLGVCALLVELHRCCGASVATPRVLLPFSGDAVCMSESICEALGCSTASQMLTCLR